MTARAVALDNLRALSGEELALHLREQRGQLFQVRLQQTIGQVENHRQIRAIRQEIARTMTVQVEIRLAAERGETVPAPAAAVTPVRPRRFRGAAAARTVEVPEVSADAPVEEAISDVVIERVEPETKPAKARSRKRDTQPAVDAPGEEAESAATGAQPEEDQP
jgi:ribosomal protein L29